MRQGPTSKVLGVLALSIFILTCMLYISWTNRDRDCDLINPYANTEIKFVLPTLETIRSESSNFEEKEGESPADARKQEEPTEYLPPLLTEAAEFQHPSLDALVLNRPPWVDEQSWGLTNEGFNSKILPSDFAGGGLDKEAEIAWNNFFNGTTNGLVFELGAMNGKDYSASKFFEKKPGWKTILIEASPQALEIPKNRPNALSLHLAVCEEEKIIHFVNGGDVGGILEFMTTEFIKSFHGSFLMSKTTIYGNGTEIKGNVLDMDKVRQAENVVEQPCLPLQTVFTHFQINRINFMVLDLEGGELAALKSLDFNKIEIDVLCVETNRFNNPKEPYIDQVVEFLIGKGYVMYKRIIGRNTWFLSPNFKF